MDVHHKHHVEYEALGPQASFVNDLPVLFSGRVFLFLVSQQKIRKQARLHAAHTPGPQTPTDEEMRARSPSARPTTGGPSSKLEGKTLCRGNVWVLENEVYEPTW